MFLPLTFFYLSRGTPAWTASCMANSASSGDSTSTALLAVPWAGATVRSHCPTSNLSVSVSKPRLGWTWGRNVRLLFHFYFCVFLTSRF